MRVVRVGVCLLVAFAVAAHGVVEVWSESALEIGAALLLLVWGILAARSSETEIRWSELNWPIAGFFVWAGVQLALRFTLYPYLSWTALLRWGACFVIYFVAMQAFQGRRAMRYLISFLLLLGFCVALEGIIQHFTSNGKIYWVRAITVGGEFFGPYVNRNHFAGMMELIIPLGLALLLFRGTKRDMVPLVGLLTILPVSALFLSGSRGGLVALFASVAFLLLLFFARKKGKLRAGPAVMFVVVLGSLVAWLGAGEISSRFSRGRPGEVNLSRRVSMFKSTARIFADYPATGTGLGTLVAVFPRYEAAFDGKVVDHAHNDYVEAAAELGIPGIIAGLAFLWLLASGGFSALKAEQSRFSFAYHAGALAACAGMLVHSFVDFNLHIPANALLFLVLAGLTASSPLPQENQYSQNTSNFRGHSRVDRDISSSP